MWKSDRMEKQPFNFSLLVTSVCECPASYPVPSFPTIHAWFQARHFQIMWKEMLYDGSGISTTFLWKFFLPKSVQGLIITKFHPPDELQNTVCGHTVKYIQSLKNKHQVRNKTLLVEAMPGQCPIVHFTLSCRGETLWLITAIQSSRQSPCRMHFLALLPLPSLDEARFSFC